MIRGPEEGIGEVVRQVQAIPYASPREVTAEAVTPLLTAGSVLDRTPSGPARAGPCHIRAEPHVLVTPMPVIKER